MISTTNQTLYRLDLLNAQQEKLTYQLSTGKKLQYGSDDADVFTRDIYIDDKIRMYEGIKTQIEKTDAQNNASDSALGEAKNLLSLVKANIIKALNDTTSDDAKLAISEELVGIKESLFRYANEQVEGEYLFAGSDSSVKPFVIDETTGKVTYQGDNELRKVAVDDGFYRQKGAMGLETFFYTADTAYKNETLEFSTEDRVFDEDGSEWVVSQQLDVGENFTFYNHPIVDGNGISWTLNSAIPQLEDGSGNTIAVTNNGDGSYTTDPIPASTNGLGYNMLRKLNEDGSYVQATGSNIAYLYISGTYPDDLNVTTPNLDGTKFEAKSNVFDFLDTTINALNKEDSNGNPVTDEQADDILADSLNEISLAYDSMNVGHTTLGTRNKMLELALESVTTKITQYSILSQEVAGADLAQVAVEAKALELTYSALYSTINKMNELSLVNFIR